MYKNIYEVLRFAKQYNTNMIQYIWSYVTFTCNLRYINSIIYIYIKEPM